MYLKLANVVQAAHGEARTGDIVHVFSGVWRCHVESRAWSEFSDVVHVVGSTDKAAWDLQSCPV